MGERVTGATDPLAGTGTDPTGPHEVDAGGQGDAIVVERREDRHLVTAASICPGQPDHLALDAAGPGQAVGADERQPQATSRRRCRGHRLSRSWTAAGAAGST